MKKRILSILLTLCMVLTLLPNVAWADSTAWDGSADTAWYNTSDTSFTITTAEQLAGLAQLVNEGNNFYNKTVLLGADIVLNNSLSDSARQWTPIGTHGGNGFAGIFDGCGHTVSGLYINNSENYQALFGSISAQNDQTDGTVRNLGVVNSSVTCSRYGAGIVGESIGTVANCYSSVAVTTRNGYAAGILAGSNGTATNCYNIGTITGGGFLGGIAAAPTIGSVNDCYSLAGAVPGASENTGSFSTTRGYLAGWTMSATVTGDYFNDAAGTLSRGGTLVDKLNAWVEAQGSSDYYTWQIAAGVNGGYPVQNAPLSVEQYSVTVTTQKDGAVWNSGRTFSLKSVVSSRVVTNLNAVQPDTYRVLDGGGDTGATVTVTSENASVMLNYYTISGTVSDYVGGGNSVSGLTVGLYTQDDTSFQTPLSMARTGNDGSYSIVWTPGSYAVRVAGVPNSYGAGSANVTLDSAAVTDANIMLSEITTERILITSTDHKTAYQIGDTLDVTNLQISAYMSDGTTKTIAGTDSAVHVTGFNSSSASPSQTLTVTYDGKITAYVISISRATYNGTQAGVPTVKLKTETSVTLTVQSLDSETVEYAKSESPAVPTSGWQDTTSFAGLSSGAYYYFFARVKETTVHGAGTAASAKIQTLRSTTSERLYLDISNGNIVIDPAEGGIKVTRGGSSQICSSSTEIVITGSSSKYTITANTSCFITFSGITITPAASSTSNAMNITAGTVTLTLADDTVNTLEPQRETDAAENKNRGKAALRVKSDASLIINGSSGKLIATGGNAQAYSSLASWGGSGAGIGGDAGWCPDTAGINAKPGEDSGSVTINGGVIIATGGCVSSWWGGSGSGIGGGGNTYHSENGASGAVTINGGFVTAVGGAKGDGSNQGSGIGGAIAPRAAAGATGAVTITDGTVIATGGIGNGTDASTGILTIKGGSLKASSIGGATPTNGTSPVYKATYVVPAVTADGTKVTGLTSANYNTNDIYTVDTNKVYLYLPEGTATADYNGDSSSTNVTTDGTAVFPVRQSFTATASMSGYTYGGTVGTPSVSQNPGSSTVTYYYTTDGKNSGGTEWKNINATTLNAGDYYIYAVIAASGDYLACTTEAVEFTVAKATQSAPTAPTVSGTSTSGSITVNSVAGQMYFCQLAGSTAPTAGMPGWTKATGTSLSYSSLSPNRSYDIYTYIPESANYKDSSISSALNLKTTNAKVTALAAPENVTLTKYYATGAAVIPELPGSAKATLEGGQTQYLNITWTKPESYDSTPAAENTFKWSVSAPSNYTYDTGIVSSGSITVSNKAATAVTITATEDEKKLTRSYAGAALTVTDLFEIDANAGAASYSVTLGSGTGSITSAGVLTVTKAGTFTVKVDTVAKGNYAAGSQSATLTVNKGAGSGSVTIDNWTYGDTAKTPVPKSDSNGTTSVTYSYEGADTTSYDASATAPTNAGSYKLTATFAATDLYKECSAEKSFTIATQAVTKPTADTTAFTYTGDEQTYTLTTNTLYTISNDKRSDAGGQTVTVALKDKDNYVWKNSEGSTDDLEFSFSIAKAPISFEVSNDSYRYDATAHSATVVQTENQTPAISESKFAVSYKLPADESGTESKTDVGEYDIIVTLSDDNFCFVGESDPATRSHKLGKLSISKNSVTALWKNSTKVYSGSALSPELELLGVVSGDDVQIQPTENKIAAGNYNYTAELIGSEAENYTLTNPNGSFIIQKAPVTFTLSGDMVQYDGNSHAVTVTASPDVANTISYRNSKGETVIAPSDEGSYDVYAEITDSNYRHADGTDGLARKIGVLTIYKGSAPSSYTVSFDANGGTGTTAAMPAVQAGTIRILPESNFVNTGKTFAGWQYNGKTYLPGESLVQPNSNIILKAIWNEKAFEIAGSVKEGDPAEDAANVLVTLMRGSRQIGQPVVTAADGKFSFADVAPGVYNLVANKNGVTQTILINVTDKDVSEQVIHMPQGALNSIVEVKAGSPAIVVGNLEKAFTEQDKTDAETKSVELKLTAEAKAIDSSDSTQQNIQKKDSNVKLFLDISLTKTINGSISPLDSSPVLLTAVITLPAELQGKDVYTVYRQHGTQLQTLSSTANAEGEKIEISKDKTSLTVYSKNFSTYAIAGNSNSAGSSAYTLSFETNGGSKISNVSLSSETCVDLRSYKPTREGYLFTGWYSDKELSKAIYSIKLTADSTVYAKWRDRSSNPFIDVNKDSYYYDPVLWAVDKGITNGTSATSFSPDTTCTRAQAVTFLWRALGSPKPTATSCPFTDVSKDDYYYNAVLWAIEKGITIGTSVTSFSPNDTVTRSQTVTFLWRTAGKPTVTASNPFADVKGDAYYADAVLWAVSEGISSGTTAATFSPADGCTRAQIVTFLYRYLAK